MSTRPRILRVLVVAGAVTVSIFIGGPLRQARASESAVLLPNLVADAPDNVSLATSVGERSMQLLLRFNGYVHNSGAGALDIRASRPGPVVTGKTAREVAEEVASYGSRGVSLPARLEEELASPAMTVVQRLFTSNEGNTSEPERYLARAHVDEASSAEVLYSNGDGHHHWHLQHVARYSLWNATRTAEVAPSQKVGFCLQDSQHIEPGQGPAAPVYTNLAWPYSRSCRRFEPDAVALYEGISPGWRDVYGRELAYQWIDASEVLPGEYWLREDIDPTEVVRQASDGLRVAYAQSVTTIPGFVAQPQTDAASEGEAITVHLASRSYEDRAMPVYRVLTQPQHGALGSVRGGEITYTPAAGYAGPDDFTFTAQDPNSPFPLHPEVASVSIAVKSTRPSVAISGAQAEMTAGTSVQLSATVANDSGGIEWETSAGSLAPQGVLESRFTAPLERPPGGLVTVTARLRDDPAASDQRTIAIKSLPTPEPHPEPATEPTPTSGGPSAAPYPPIAAPPDLPAPRGATSTGAAAASQTGSPSAGALRASISGLRAMLFGRMLIMTAIPSAPGGIRLTGFVGTRPLGTCASATPAGRAFTCRIAVTRNEWLRTPIGVQARLRSGGELTLAVLPARRLAGMQMGGTRRARVAAGHRAFWCDSLGLLAPLGDT